MSESDTRARAVTYLRVSTDRQAQTDFDADGYSIKAQRDACEARPASWVR
jgi:DNA invertase Pin-like site-specific DNA recombinase